MSAAASRRVQSPTVRQRGQAVILTVLLVGLGVVVLVFGAVDATGRANARAKDTEIVLAQVKDALIGWAATRGTDSAGTGRPGELPCPDTDNNGTENPADPACTAGQIGRVPWKTLGIPEPKDDSGETLWYSISGNFRRASGSTINSDTKGTLTVRSGSGAVTLTTEAVAVIFAPGAALGAQRRDATAAWCPTTGAFIARNRCAANYLETAGVTNNAAAPNGPFIQAQPMLTFNDRLTVITTADLMPVVEQRVARELRRKLMSYKAGSLCNCYPWADTSDGTSDFTVPGVGERNRRRVPLTALPEAWGVGGIPPLPAWFQANAWNLVIYYAVARNALEAGGATCSTCVDPTLTVDGAPGAEVVLITTGPAGASRPSANWTDYLEDAQNRDDANDLYVTPSSTAYPRDRIFTIPGAGTPGQCAPNAALLLNNAPCNPPGGGWVVYPECVVAAAALLVCGCAAAATAMITPPCGNTLNPTACQAAVAALKACVS